MRVIFEKEFLESIRRIDNTLKITKYVIGTIYNSYTVGEEFMEKLFSGSYLYNDVRKTSEYPLNSIWDSNKKLLKINIDIPEKVANNIISDIKFTYDRNSLIKDIYEMLNESSLSNQDIYRVIDIVKSKF